MAAPGNLPALPWSKAAPRRTRAQPLNQDLIVDTALRVLDVEGYDAVTMRRVAQELSTGPASLYAHVGNRAELDDLLVDRVVKELPLPKPDPARWREQLSTLVRDVLATYARHPGLVRGSIGRVPLGPNALKLTETVLGLLRAGGLTDVDAAYGLDVLFLYVQAVAFEHAIWFGVDRVNYFASVHTYFDSLPTKQFPNIASMVAASSFAGDESDERFQFGLTLIMDGLAARAGAPAFVRTETKPVKKAKKNKKKAKQRVAYAPLAEPPLESATVVLPTTAAQRQPLESTTPPRHISTDSGISFIN